MKLLFILSPKYVASLQNIQVLLLRIHINLYFDTGREIFNASSVTPLRQDTATRKTLVDVEVSRSLRRVQPSCIKQELGARPSGIGARGACGKPEGLVWNVSLKTHGGTCGGVTWHMMSHGEPDMGSSPDREK